MENNRELNEMIFQNYGELYDAMLNYLRENCLVTHFPSKATDTTNNQTSCFLSVVLSTGGDAKTNTAALFNTKKRLRATIMWKKHTVHCLQNTDMDLSRKTGSNTTMIRLQEVHSGEPRN